MLDLLGEIGGTLPYFYRGWFWLLSKRYRIAMVSLYNRRSKYKLYLDVLICIVFMILEIYGAIVIFELVSTK